MISIYGRRKSGNLWVQFVVVNGTEARSSCCNIVRGSKKWAEEIQDISNSILDGDIRGKKKRKK
jgi:hypothetical protein